ncbi:DUF302 domain-containing protein [Eionea flava]
MRYIKPSLQAMVTLFVLFASSLVFAGSHGEHAAHNTVINGLITVQSQHSVADTANKLNALLIKKGMTVFARIDHSAGAEKVGQLLRPTELIIFGNPKVGTPLMLCAQSIAIDLPQKMLIWEDSEGTTWLGYNDPQYLQQRHHVDGCDKILKKVAGALNMFATAASQ